MIMRFGFIALVLNFFIINNIVIKIAKILKIHYENKKMGILSYSSKSYFSCDI